MDKTDTSGGKMENDARDRCFYKLPNFDTSISEENRKSRKPELIKYISENIIGRRKVFSGPFGLRSGKCNRFSRLSTRADFI